MDTKPPNKREQDFFESPLFKEITEILFTWKSPWAVSLDWRLAASGVPTPTGHIFMLIITDNEAPGSNLVEIKDEKLLEKLRSVTGQYSYKSHPIYYYEDAPISHGG